MNNAEPTLLSAAWRYRWLVLVVTSVAVALGLVYQFLQPRETMFQSQATLVIQEPTSTEESSFVVGPSNLFLRSQLEIMQSPVVAEAAAAILSEEDLEVLASEVETAVSVFGSETSPLVSIVATAPTADLAAAYANAVAEGYRDVSQIQASATSTAQLERIRAQVDQIDISLEEIDEALAALISEDPALESLRLQAEDAVAEISRLQQELIDAEGGDAADIRQEIQDYRQAIIVYAEVQVAAVGPEQRALLEEQIRQVERRAGLLTLQDEIAVDAGLAPDAVALVQPAVAAEPIGGIGLSRVLAVGLILGLALGVGLAYFLTVWRRTFTLRSEPESVLGVPMLADIPDFEHEGLESAVPVRDHPRSVAAEAFRFAAGGIEAGLRMRELKSVFFVSSTLGHGKTTAAVNTGVASAINGRSVLVVDCDFGNQEASRLLAGPRYASLAGVTDVIEGVGSVTAASHLIDLGNGVTISLMPRGTRPSLAASALQSDRAKTLFDDIRDLFDVVLIDGPPMLQVAYSSTLAELADALVVVVEHQGSHSQLAELTGRLELIGTPALGYLYNRSPLRREMTMSEGSMMDILGDSGFVEDAGPWPRRKRSG